LPIHPPSRQLSPYYQDVPCHHTETERDSRSRSTAEPTEASYAYCFVSLTYIPEYVGNHFAASVASASQPQASWQ
jgi:hypothetical protein